MTGFFDFDSLVREVRPQLVRYVSRLVGDADAEDVVQIVLSNAASALSAFRGDASPRTWLFRIATNAAHDWNRSHRKALQEPLELSNEENESAVSAEDTSQERQLVRKEMSQCVSEVLRNLPESYQIVLALGDCEELSDREVGDVLGVSLGATKIRLHRARAKMKEALEGACSFYHDAENTLCCDRKQKSSGNAYLSNGESRLQIESRTTSGDFEVPNEESTMSTIDTLPIKARHLIGVGAAIAAGCQPCTKSYVAAAKTEGACERGVRFAIEQGLNGRQTATAAITDFAAVTFTQPELDDAFRAEKAMLSALIDVATAIASNAASSLTTRIETARALGATNSDLRVTARIAQTAKRGAERALEAALSAVLGDITDASPVPCCADRSADKAEGACACGAES